MTENKCYDCKHRGTIPGDAHSRCRHPVVKKLGGDDPFKNMMAIFASVGRAPPQIAQRASDALKIEANYHGIKNGWFNWPYNFDPVWLAHCEGFENKNAKNDL